MGRGLTGGLVVVVLLGADPEPELIVIEGEETPVRAGTMGVVLEVEAVGSGRGAVSICEGRNVARFFMIFFTFASIAASTGFASENSSSSFPLPSASLEVLTVVLLSRLAILLDLDFFLSVLSLSGLECDLPSIRQQICR